MAYTFTRQQSGETISENDVNELQVAIEDISGDVDTLNAAQGAALAPSPPSPLRNFALGVSTHISWGQSSTVFDGELKRHQDDGVTVVRSDISWRNVETADGTYSSTELDHYDSAVWNTQKRGQTLILTLFEVPNWAHTPSTDWYKPPADFQKIADFASDMAARWSSAHHIVWEIWNEPSYWGNGTSSGFWHPFGAPTPLGGNYPAYAGVTATDETTTANAYADLCVYVYAAIKAVAPHHLVLGGSLHRNYPAWLTKVYQRSVTSWGGKRLWDTVSGHGYCRNREPYDYSAPADSFIGSIYDVRAAMNTGYTSGAVSLKDNGPLWITEFGYDSSATPSSGAPALAGADAAARDVTRGDYFERVMDICRQYPYVQTLCVFTPSPVETCDVNTYDFTLYKSGANLPSYDRILAKGRSMSGGRVAATAAVAAGGHAISSGVWYPVVFKGVDTEDTDNMHFLSDSNLTGTVKRTNGSTALVGYNSSTQFLTQLSVGQVLYINNNATYTVTGVTSDTAATIYPASSTSDADPGVTAQRRADYITAPYAGAYTAVGWFTIPANSTGIRMGRFLVNGTVMAISGPITAPDATNATGFTFTAKLNLRKYDRVSMDAYQSSGGSLTIPASGAGLTLVRDAPLGY